MTSEGKTVARGYKLPRCPTCCLPLTGCICAFTPTLHTRSQWWILIHPAEWIKPTNTARLIGATIPQTRFFPWYRTVPPAALMALLQDGRFMPYVLFPHGDPTLFAGLRERPWLPDRTPAFVLLDGTWSQVRKIFSQSPYLHDLPRLAIQPPGPSAYTLRRQRCATHRCTVEVAIALLEQVEELTASSTLRAYFHLFAASYMAARHGHRLLHPPPDAWRLLTYSTTLPPHTTRLLPVGARRPVEP
jgi:DTW domain-containing protein YfiP